jgi:hypothetical protein
VQEPPLQQHQPQQLQQNTSNHARQSNTDSKCPLADSLELASWPTQYKMAPLPKYYEESDPRKFLMSYEAVIASCGEPPPKTFLDKNNDIFAWRTSNLMGVSRDILEHKLQTNPSTRPKRQKLCKMSDEKVVTAKAEV